MNKHKNRIAAAFLSCAMAVTNICSAATAYGAGKPAAEWQQSATYKGSNLNAQNYSKWSKPVRSYLVSCGCDSLMRIQYAESMDGILAEYYDKSYKFKSSKLIPKELPVFGGFYETDQNYYILTGQKNINQLPDMEVYRITKYDKDWKRIGSAGIKNCNTKNPFDAASARMDVYKNYLLIRTGRVMYSGHQANITFQLDMNTMKITDSYVGESNLSAGYVSHSFNQFIKVEDGHIVAVDHGDAFPRSIVLTKYNTDLSNGRFSGRCSSADILKFAGTMMSGNATGGSAGGFEISGSSYLVAGNSVVQDNRSLSRKTRNVFVAAADKKNISQVTVSWLTDYDEGEETTSTPHMVKISEDKYMVLWTVSDNVYYTTVDGKGKQTGRTYEMSGTLSDCVPVISDGRLVWYTWEDENIVFYEITVSDLSKNRSRAIRNGTKPDSATGGSPDTTGTVPAGRPDTSRPVTTVPAPSAPAGSGPDTSRPAATVPDTKKEYTVTFNANGGIVDGYRFLDVTTINQKLSDLPVAYRSGYSFEGWFTDADGGTKVSASVRYTKNQVLYAHWKNDSVTAEYKITFDANGGTVNGSTVQYTSGNKLKELPEAVRDGYEFQYWYTSEGVRMTESDPFEKDTVLYARWKKQDAGPEYSDFHVAKLTDTEAVIQVTIPSSYVKYWAYAYGPSAEQLRQSPVIAPGRIMDTFTIKLSGLMPDTKYYYYMYYISDTKKHVSDMRVITTKQHTGKEYTVTFHANGGTIEGPAVLTTVNQKLPSLPSAYRKGYTFPGWYNLANSRVPADTSRIFDEDETLYAYWIPDSSDHLETDPDSGGADRETDPTADPGTAGKPDTGTVPDAGMSGKPDADSGSGSGTGTAGKPDTGKGTDSDTGTAGKPDTGTAGKPDTGKGTGSGTGTAGKPDTGTGSGSGTGTAGKPGTGTNGKPDTGTDAEPDTGTDNGPDTDTDMDTDTDFNVNPDTGSYMESDFNTETESDSDSDAGINVSIKKVKIQSVKSPSGGKLKIKWKRSNNSDGYQISCSRSKSFPAKKTTVRKAKAASQPVVFSGLSKGKIYYVRIRAYQKADGKIYYGNWSKVKKVRIKK